MRIFTEQMLKEYSRKHPAVLTALQEWIQKVEKCKWTSAIDVKKTSNSVDSIENQRFVFNIKGNDYRLAAVIKFTIGFVYIRFVGTHAEYDKIDCNTI